MLGSVAAVERSGNLAVMTICGSEHSSFTTNRHQPATVAAPGDRAFVLFRFVAARGFSHNRLLRTEYGQSHQIGISVPV
jgi:hypothetical protein